MQNENYMLVLYELYSDNISVRCIGQKSISKKDHDLLKEDSTKEIMAENKTWEIKRRRFFDVKTSAYDTFFVIVDCNIKPIQ